MGEDDLEVLKCFSWLGLQVHEVDCLVRSRKGQAMSKKEGMNLHQT